MTVAAAMAITVFRKNCTLLDCTGADPSSRSTVIVEGVHYAGGARRAAGSAA